LSVFDLFDMESVGKV